MVVVGVVTRTIPDGVGMRGCVVAAMGVVIVVVPVVAVGMMIRSDAQIPAPGVVELAHVEVAVAVIIERVVAHIDGWGANAAARAPTVGVRHANDDGWAITAWIVASQPGAVVGLAGVVVVAAALRIVTPTTAAGADED